MTRARYWGHVRQGVASALAGLALLTAPAAAQVAGAVDPALLETWRLQTGGTVRFCYYETSPTTPFDQAVGEEIAGRLLLDSSFTPLRMGYGIGGEYAAEDLFIALTNDCDVMLGMGLAANAYPQEFTVTRPYVGFSYVLVVTDPEIRAISDIPTDQRIGAPVGSYGFIETVRYAATRPESQRWMVLPYGTEDLMLTRLLDGTIGGMVIYGPSFAALTGTDPRAQGLPVLSLEPQMTARIEAGGLLLSRNSFLRELLDDAIDSMVADGTIARLIEEAGLEGVPNRPGGFTGN